MELYTNLYLYRNIDISKEKGKLKYPLNRLFGGPPLDVVTWEGGGLFKAQRIYLNDYRMIVDQITMR